MPPQMNPRKRAAPDSGQLYQMGPSQTVPASQMTNEQFLQWSHNNGSTSYQEHPLSYPPNMYQSTTSSELAPQQSQSSQLTRRPVSQQLVPREGNPYLTGDDESWQDFGQMDELNQPGNEWMNNDEEVEQRALIAKREAQAKRKQIPPFVQKLSSFLDDAKNTHFIRWSENGDSFIVLDEDEFAKTLIPELFKHNNYASFVRQLNMYGFHKKVGLSDNSMKASERKNKSPSEYYNPFFKRGRPNLLWLINKTKNQTQAKGRRNNRNNQDGGEKGSDDDDKYADDTLGGNEAFTTNALPTSQGSSAKPRGLIDQGESGGLQRRELTEVQHQLQSIQQQQRIISGAINRLRKDNNQLYEQAAAFQSMHSRHESSINAILTFLATVYNRSLEGHGGQNITNMFGSAIPQDVQAQGNVVDVGDYGDQDSSLVSGQTQRRWPRKRLLLGPPTQDSDGSVGRAATVSPAPSASTPLPNSYGQIRGSGTQQSGTVEEVYEQRPHRPSQSPQVSSNLRSNGLQRQNSEQRIMEIINSTNEKSDLAGARFDFPAALEHSQTANGNSPLTPKQRDDMINLMTGNSNASKNANNALLSPNPPPFPELQRFENNNADLDMLSKMTADQQESLDQLATQIQPLSPNGVIPGLANGQYYSGQPAEAPGALDLDQIFNSDYFNNADGGDFADFGDHGDIGENTSFPFDKNAQGSNEYDANDQDQQGGQIVGTADGSAITSPAAEGGSHESGTSPNRRRRR